MDVSPCGGLLLGALPHGLVIWRIAVAPHGPPDQNQSHHNQPQIIMEDDGDSSDLGGLILLAALSHVLPPSIKLTSAAWLQG